MVASGLLNPEDSNLQVIPYSPYMASWHGA
jgi:hypothetical protein